VEDGFGSEFETFTIDTSYGPTEFLGLILQGLVELGDLFGDNGLGVKNGPAHLERGPDQKDNGANQDGEEQAAQD
jgi:hypothetical protein